MNRSTRLFEIIQILRRARGPVTAAAMAAELEVTTRTIYRDVVSLQAMRVPIVGEAGVGYILRPGYDLPPMNFTAEEVEAIVVGLALIGRTGDPGLARAAASVGRKISAMLPDGKTHPVDDPSVFASGWSAVPAGGVDLARVRRAIREEERLAIVYIDEQGARTERTILPIALAYFIEAVVIAAWCELRGDFRHFRADRMLECRPDGTRFTGRGAALRSMWRETQRLP